MDGEKQTSLLFINLYWYTKYLLPFFILHFIRPKIGEKITPPPEIFFLFLLDLLQKNILNWKKNWTPSIPFLDPIKKNSDSQKKIKINCGP